MEAIFGNWILELELDFGKFGEIGDIGVWGSEFESLEIEVYE